MIKSLSSNKPLGKFFIVFISLVLLGSISGTVYGQESNKQEIVRQVAQKWIDVGMEQYDRGNFKTAEQSFLRARDYESYLTSGQKEQLESLLQKAHLAVINRARDLEHVEAGNRLIAQGDLSKAKLHFENVRGSEFLTREERGQVTDRIEQINSELNQQSSFVAELIDEGLLLLEEGQLEQAREMLAKVIRREDISEQQRGIVEGHLSEIDKTLASREIRQAGGATPIANDENVSDMMGFEVVQEPVIVIEEKPKAKTAERAEPAQRDSYIDTINRRREIIQSHTEAVYKDTMARSAELISNHDFSNGIGLLEEAQILVNRNERYLGDDLYRYYSSGLNQQFEKVEQARKELTARREEQRRTDAIRSQQQHRNRMDMQRNERIEELIANAKSYQRQQRYEEALGQLQILLALDPLNDDALILKQTLEDMVAFRRQIEINDISRQERNELLLRADEARIPYAEEITYPRNWREISARREQSIPMGENPIDTAIYEQLDSIVDLSNLNPDLPFSEAIDELRYSVNPPLALDVLWPDLLYNADVQRNSPINMNGTSNIPLSTALDRMLRTVSGGVVQLGYVVQDGSVTIGTVQTLPRRMETRVYDISVILDAPANYTDFSQGGGTRGGSVDSAGGGFDDGGQRDQRDSAQLQADVTQRATGITALIQETVSPDSWFDSGVGEGTIQVYSEGKKLVVNQTREIHRNIDELLTEMRRSLGEQVAIEARFLLVQENFLQDIGLDLDVKWNPGGKFSIINFQQNSFGNAAPENTGVPGSLVPAGSNLSPAFRTGGRYGDIAMLDDLEVSFLIKATQDHRNAQSVVAPKVSVLSGETASMRVQNTLLYARNIEVDIREGGGLAGRGTYNINYDDGAVNSGSILNVTPTIMPDKKHVLLNITAELHDFKGFRSQSVPIPIMGGDIGAPSNYVIQFPETETSRVQTRVSVPDRGTLLLGGQQLSAEIEKESGIPVLSKLPIIGRAFSNRSQVKDSRILLILVKPTIILNEEHDADAMARTENRSMYW